ncbi:FkbM family methyltransferase (plasmid) [Sinorhizobium meliloti WSM1022]|uniref:FkbM family methyltransferase n=1 Tax=Rhizobium meliloti TaxID=382 RepID=UPI0015722D94|nr:FkbM family methyltransferase [Sinorhizobium meliloti]QKN17642.1 FkbM family methyltransferase [Sinorhizobium meliloti WSM1022]
MMTEKQILKVNFDDKLFQIAINNPEDHIAKIIRKSGSFYESEILRSLLCFDFKDSWAIDVGANIGNHSIFFSGVLGLRTLAIEPSPEASMLLEENIELNDLVEKIVPRAVAAWSHRTAGSIVEPDDANLGRAFFEEDPSGPVEADTIDSLAAGKAVALLKIDVEGAELPALRGALNTIREDQPLLIIECQSFRSLFDVKSEIGGLGYFAIGRFNATPTYVFATEGHLKNVFFDGRFNSQDYLLSLNEEKYKDLLIDRRITALKRELDTTKRDAETVRKSANVLKTEADKEKREANKAKLEAEKAKLEADKAKLEADKAKLEGDKAKLEADEVKLEIDRIKFIAEKTKWDAEKTKREAEQIRKLAKAEISAEKAAKKILEDEALRLRYIAKRHNKKISFLMAQRSSSMRGRLGAFLAKYFKIDLLPPYQSFAQYKRKVDGELKRLRISAAASANDRRNGDIFSPLTRHSSDPIIAKLATFPPREENLEKVIQCLLPQVDEIHVYLNEYNEVPTFLKRDKIKTFLGHEHSGDLKDNGKLYNIDAYGNCFILLCDDDILYPPDYAQSMKEATIRYGFTSIVGVHGTTYQDPAQSYIKDRSVIHFKDASDDALVDQLGSGTVAFHTSMRPIRWEDIETSGMLDLWLARASAQKGFASLAVRRPKGWLKPLPQVGHTIFNAVKVDDTKESQLLTDKLLPALQNSPRRHISNHVNDMYTELGCRNRGIQSVANITGTTSNFEPCHPILTFEIIVTGWNCRAHVEKCISSIARQKPGPYRLKIRYHDDGSTDGTPDKLNALSADVRMYGQSSSVNMGPAYARDVLIRQVNNPDAICVLIDMDDELLPEALYDIARVYIENPDCLMTYGNWVNQHGRLNTEGRYTAEEIDTRSYRRMDKFLMTHLRTFKRHLYDAVTEDNLKDGDGNWLRYCSDVGLMFPLLDQCSGSNVIHFEKPLYLYNQYRTTGTQTRFGGAAKKQMFLYLRDEERLFRFKSASTLVA